MAVAYRELREACRGLVETSTPPSLQHGRIKVPKSETACPWQTASRQQSVLASLPYDCDTTLYADLGRDLDRVLVVRRRLRSRER